MLLRRADRLFDILRVLRTASRPVTAASFADELEVTVRRAYRDIATLQTRRSLARDFGMTKGSNSIDSNQNRSVIQDSASPLRSAKDLEGSTMKRVEGVDDLNSRIICAQGIVGVGATIRTRISSHRMAASRSMASIGLPADPASSCPSECSHASSAVSSWKD